MRIHDDDVEDGEDGTVLYEGEPFTGEVVETGRSGSVVSLVTYADGVEDGPWLEWHEDGQKKVEGQTARGGAVGVWRKWHRNGTLAEERVFNEELDTVSYKSWDESGNVIKDRDYAR